MLLPHWRWAIAAAGLVVLMLTKGSRASLLCARERAWPAGFGLCCSEMKLGKYAEQVGAVVEGESS